MVYTNRVDGYDQDSFDRLRVSLPFSEWAYQNQYNKGPNVWYEKTSGTASSSHLPNESMVQLSVTGTGSIVRQTRRYFRYVPGHGIRTLFTFCWGALQSGATHEFGYGDDDNGIFMRRVDTTGVVSLVMRSKTTGSAVDTVVAQADWNEDKVDGTGASGFTLDKTKSQIIGIDLQWLGVGDIRVYLFAENSAILLHRFKNANVLSGTYMTTANLPVRYKLSSTAVGAVTSKQGCSAVDLEQGQMDDHVDYAWSTNMGITPVSVTTRRPVLSVRPAATFNSIVNRAKIVVQDVTIRAATNDILWEVVWGGTLTGASFAAVHSESVVERDVSASSISGGITVASGYVVAGGSMKNTLEAAVNGVLPLTLDIDGANPTNYSVVVTSVSGTASVLVAMDGEEIY